MKFTQKQEKLGRFDVAYVSCEIQVGFGRADIMPQGPIKLGGLGNGPFRISNNILDTICATCIAITDSEGQTLLLITMDLLHAMQGMVADMRAIITEQTGIPGEHIMIAATHTHAGPDIFNPGPKTVDDYIEYCVKRVPLELNAVRLGELARATAPCEMFDTCGAYVKDNSPFENTLMLAYCNGSYGYFPTQYAFEYRCYESDTHKYALGSAEEMAENLVEMLKELQ